ncbi:crossover junction endodeoxyribonuclease RuvC [Patescibacteria group bacterium]
MRKILAIDPGTATTGYAILKTADKQREKPRIVTYGCITTRAKTPAAKRLQTIAQDLRQLIKEHQPNELAVEKLFFAKNVTTGMAVGQARGVILLAGAEADLAITEYTPLQIKQAITGYGQASKQQIQAMIKNIFKLADIPKPDDAADAIAIGLCHWQTVKL